MRHTAGRAFSVSRSSNGNGTRTTLPRVIERLAVPKRVAVFLRGVQEVEGAALPGGMQPFLLARFIFSDENNETYAPRNTRRLRLIEPDTASLFNGASIAFMCNSPLQQYPPSGTIGNVRAVSWLIEWPSCDGGGRDGRSLSRSRRDTWSRDRDQGCPRLCWRRSITPTSRRSMASSASMAFTRWSWSWSKARRWRTGLPLVDFPSKRR